MHVSTISAAAVAFAISISPAQAFEWSSYLQKSPADLEAALGSSASCKQVGFFVPLKIVVGDTEIQPNIHDPVRNPIFVNEFNISKEDIDADRDDSRFYDSDSITKITCTIGKEATVTSFGNQGRIFRIELQYDRCRQRREEKILLSEMTDRVCRDLDAYEKPFDKEVYKAIMASEHHGERDDVSWFPLLTDENSQTEWVVLSDLRCEGRPELQNWMRGKDRSQRCLMSIDNSDPTHWQATTMFEVYEAGLIRDKIDAHLASTRVFVDLPAEKNAVKSMMSDLQKMVDGIKAKIAARVADKAAKDGAVSDLLGAGN
jgi:hypothetical protein